MHSLFPSPRHTPNLREITDAAGDVAAWKHELIFLGLQIHMTVQGINVGGYPLEARRKSHR